MELPANFIFDAIEEDLAQGVATRIQTRFPPEPNGYLHIGHAKAIAIDFLTAKKYGGRCNLRLDDTNPAKEEEEYVAAIQEDIQWLGFHWDKCLYASSYFEFIHECAVQLIQAGKAFVCDLTAEELRETRGTLTEPGKESPFRTRSIDETLDLFQRMTAGEFPDGTRTLRAKIDMTSPNLNLRDPVLYRIAHVSHHQTGDKWCVYPMYDFAHPLCDAKEGVTYSLCSLEFENHRPLYDWVIREVGFEEPPRQIEFARLNLNFCVTSKRRSLALVEQGHVTGWDDPRMVTLRGLRRRGCPPEAVLDFVSRVGVSKAHSVVEYRLLEACIREALSPVSERTMVVLNPLRLVIENYPEGQTEEIVVERHPEDPEMGTATLPFSRELFVEREDFELDPPRKFHRLFVGNEVRLKGAYYVTCTRYDLDEDGTVTCLYCTYDPESRGGDTEDKRKVRGTLHWINAATAQEAEVRVYDRLFKTDNPSTDDYLEFLNPKSLTVRAAKIDASLQNAAVGTSFQFLRQGYFCVDSDSRPGALVLNRTVTLNSSY